MNPSPELTGAAGALMRGMSGAWWTFVLRGVAAIAFGTVALLYPGLGLVALLAFIAAWLAVDGVMSIWQALTGRGGAHWIWGWIDGLLSLAAAAALFFAPGLSLFVLLVLAGAIMIVTGITRIILAFQASDFLLGLLGVVTAAFGAMLIFWPGPGLLALVWLLALEAILMGVILIAVGFRLRRLKEALMPG